MTCEVCHEKWNPVEWKQKLAEYQDSIYRPGEEMDYDAMTEPEHIAYREEIADIFAHPEGHRPEDHADDDEGVTT